MRIAHIADLHIGKRLSGYDLREDQSYIFDQMIEKMNEADV
jgi:DNA repair exonuclease SbcCD nuclease subunit